MEPSDEQRIGEILGGFEGVLAVYLFGSHADGTNRSNSDIDLAVVPASESVRDRRIEMLTALVQAGFDNLDLVFLDGTDAVLRYHAVRRNRPLYSAPGFSLGTYFSRALREYWDLEPLLRVQQAAYKRRALRG